MNAIDITALILVGYLSIKGFMNGLVREVLSVVAIAVAGTLAYLFNRQILPLLPGTIAEIEGVSFIGPIAVFLSILLIFRVLSGFLTRSLRELALSTTNRILGALFGTVKAVLLSCLLLFLVTLLFQFLEKNIPTLLIDARTYSLYLAVIELVKEYASHA